MKRIIQIGEASSSSPPRPPEIPPQSFDPPSASPLILIDCRSHRFAIPPCFVRILLSRSKYLSPLPLCSSCTQFFYIPSSYLLHYYIPWITWTVIHFRIPCRHISYLELQVSVLPLNRLPELFNSSRITACTCSQYTMSCRNISLIYTLARLSSRLNSVHSDSSKLL